MGAYIQNKNVARRITLYIKITIMNTQLYIDEIKYLYSKFKKQLEPLKEYWLRLSQRDQQILIIILIMLILTIVYFMIYGAVAYRDKLTKESILNQQQYEESVILAREYKYIKRIPVLDYHTPNSDIIKQDVMQILDVKDADVTVTDNILNIKANNVSFDNVILFLEQLRKAYGMFPMSLKISKLPVSGEVALNISYNFKLNQS